MTFPVELPSVKSTPLSAENLPKGEQVTFAHVFQALEIGERELAENLLSRVCKTKMWDIYDDESHVQRSRVDDFDLSLSKSVHVLSHVVWVRLGDTENLQGAFDQFTVALATLTSRHSAKSEDVTLLDSLSIKISEVQGHYWSFSWKQRVVVS